ncbi:MAG: NAD(P)H-hydrate dehydratase [Solirubrobacteraceae bacterium]
MQTLPDWCAPLPDARRMREIDRWAIEERGTPSLELMERAGAGVAVAVERLCPDGAIAVVCGKGNNGGDGLVVARLLRERGRDVSVLLATALESLSVDARENLLALPGAAPIQLGASGDAASGDGLATKASAALERADAIVDALLGTGFKGSPEGVVLAAIEAIERAPAIAIAIDVPSGVDASSGVVAGAAVRAELTVTFHSGKPGLYVMPGKELAGEVELIDIGIPRGAPADAEIGLIGAAALALPPRRSRFGTKFTSGRVIVAGGSRGLAGAPRMAGEAAMRAGAGYVTVCLPASLQPIFAAGPRPELMSRAMHERDGAFAVEAVEQVAELADAAGALALGPGLGRAQTAVEFARALARAVQVPLVLDADALNAHAGRLSELAERDRPTVLTPHEGELGRLLEIEPEEVKQRRLQHVRAAAAKAQAVVVLKGDDTLIAQPDGLVAVSPGATPALATAGTGDVLTGVIAALLAQRLSAFEAACAGVRLHALAGTIAERHAGCAEAVIASDVIAALGAARADGAAAAEATAAGRPGASGELGAAA